MDAYGLLADFQVVALDKVLAAQGTGVTENATPGSSQTRKLKPRRENPPKLLAEDAEDWFMEKSLAFSRKYGDIGVEIFIGTASRRVSAAPNDVIICITGFAVLDGNKDRF